jgi:hypothetical protein
VAGSEGARGDRSVGPAAAALVIIGSIVGGSLMSNVSGDGARSGSIASSNPAPSVEVSRPEQPTDLGPDQGSIPVIAADQGASTSVSLSPEMVVKFKDDTRIKPVTDLFWKNPAGARRKFLEMRSKRVEFAGLKLDRVTYSNELVLVPDTGSKKTTTAREMRETARKLMKSPDIEYAEVSMTAHPGGDR